MQARLLKESDPLTHFALRASIIVIIRGLFMFIPYLGTDTSCEVMEVDPDGSEIDQLSEVNVTGDEEVQGRINAYGSPVGANSRELRRESAIVSASELPSTSQNINRVVRISSKSSIFFF